MNAAPGFSVVSAGVVRIHHRDRASTAPGYSYPNWPCGFGSDADAARPPLAHLGGACA